MLTLNSDENKSTCFKFIGADATTPAVRLISDNISLIAPTCGEGCMDTCSFYSGPSDATIMAFGEGSESCGSIAYTSGESCGSIAYSGGESCGSIASSGSFSGGGGSFSGGGCSYSC